jgi:Pyruvate/2-oxoacid:ferredoxin oxidoreductase delta subunit
MAMRITEECISCGACEPECPHDAIAEGESVYLIDRQRCTGCPGHAPVPCVAVCPVDCISADRSPRPPEARPEPEPPAARAPEPRRRDPFLFLRVLWGALMGSTLIYLLAGSVLGGTGSLDPVLLAVLAGAAVALAAASLFVPARLLRSALRALELPVEEVHDLAAERPYREAAPAHRRFVDASSARQRAASTQATAMVIGLACAEAVCALGLVVRLLGASWPQAAGFFVVGGALMIAQLPSRARLGRKLEQTYRARLE